MCACMYVCIMYVCMHYVCMYVCIMYACIMYVYTYYVCMYVLCMYVLCMCIYMYIHTHTVYVMLTSLEFYVNHPQVFNNTSSYKY